METENHKGYLEAAYYLEMYGLAYLGALRVTKFLLDMSFGASGMFISSTGSKANGYSR